MSVRENLVLGAYQLGNAKAMIEQRLDQVFRLFPRLRIGVKMFVSFFDSTFGAVVHGCCARARRGIDASVPESVVG
jgi:hypothetical protein